MRGDVTARLAARVLRLSPSRRIATVALRSVGRGRSYSAAYASATERLAPVVDGSPLGTSRQLGRLVRVHPTATGAELDLIVGDDGAWQLLAGGAARVDVLVAFERSYGGEPTGGRPQRVEIT